jgi:hypothetical protein
VLTKSDSGIGGCPIACSFVPSPPAPHVPGDTALFVPGVPWGHSTFAFPAFQGTQHVCAFPGVQHFWTGECPLPCSLSPRIVAGLLAWYTAVICRLLYIFLRFEGGGPGGTVFRGCSGDTAFVRCSGDTAFVRERSLAPMQSQSENRCDTHSLLYGGGLPLTLSA